MVGAEQAPWSDSEFVAEKKVDPGDEKLFEERLAAIKRYLTYGLFHFLASPASSIKVWLYSS